MRGPNSTRPGTCKDCSHFFITHDPNFPYGCGIMGFKSRHYPHLEVLAATGATCVAREAKPRGKRGGD